MEVGLLLIRLVVGLFLAGHGAQKLFGWFGGHGTEGTDGRRRCEQVGPERLEVVASLQRDPLDPPRSVVEHRHRLVVGQLARMGRRIVRRLRGVDTMVRIDKTSSGVAIEVEKQKDDEAAKPIAVAFKKITMGADASGRPSERHPVHQKSSTQPRAVRLSSLPAQHRAQGALKWARDLGQRITPTFESN